MASTAEDQILFVHRVAMNPADRAAFIADPAKFAAKNKVELDAKFSASVAKQLKQIDKDYIRVGGKIGPGGPGDPIGPVANAVVAVAAVVSAAAAVVTAVTAVYQATKWKNAGPLEGIREIRGVKDLRSVAAIDIAAIKNVRTAGGNIR